MNGGLHFTRKDSFVDQHRWPFSWHIPMCIVLWGLQRKLVPISNEWGVAFHKERFLCWPTWVALFLAISHVHCLTRLAKNYCLFESFIHQWVKKSWMGDCHFRRKSSFVDQYRWPFLGIFPCALFDGACEE